MNCTELNGIAVLVLTAIVVWALVLYRSRD